MSKAKNVLISVSKDTRPVVNTPEDSDATGRAGADEVRAALQDVLADPEFLRNANSSRFLKFIVEETLAGRGPRLKAFTIATLALQRSEDFNPQSNSIVRVQAMRLRELLSDFYAGPGAGAAIEIHLPRGVYQPEFVRRGVPEPEAEKAETVEPEENRSEIAGVLPASAPKSTLRSPAWMLLVTALLCVGSLIFVVEGISLRRKDPLPAMGALPPLVAVREPELYGEASQQAVLGARFLSRLESGLSAFDYFTLRKGSPSAVYDYAISSRFIVGQRDKVDLELRLVRDQTGDVLWSHRYPGISTSDPPAIESVAANAVITLGDIGGAIFSDIRTRLSQAHAPLEGYACVLAGMEYVRERVEARRLDARKCLENELSANPDEYGALAALANILVISYLNRPPESRGAADLQRALLLARRAYDIAPQRAETQTALFFTRFYDKRYDDAFQVARQAVETNPAASLLMARIARAYISRERYDEGLALLAPFEGTNAGPPASAFSILAVAALMRGDNETALTYSLRSGASASPMGLVTRIIACHQAADDACVIAASRQLRASYPGFSADVADSLDRHVYADAIKAKLLNGLAAAGFSAQETTLPPGDTKP